ncbi:hypothetical protein HDU99_006729 [Rhizoclosmatium hyalinum]|nr:hypothetical protein HDU99_006729 [Rhizoclosmatium hyalinum]
MGMYPALFCQLFFTQLLISQPPPNSANKSADDHVRGIFEKLKAIKESADLCEGIEFFLDQYVVPRGKEEKPRMGVSVDSLGATKRGALIFASLMAFMFGIGIFTLKVSVQNYFENQTTGLFENFAINEYGRDSFWFDVDNLCVMATLEFALLGSMEPRYIHVEVPLRDSCSL